jgi:hypothetical protein
MPCYRCGVRQTDPSRGSSPWRRGVRGDHLVLVCPACQAAVPDWAADLDRCDRCDGTHLIRRLGQVECLDCDWIRDPALVTPAPPTPSRATKLPTSTPPACAASPDPSLAGAPSPGAVSPDPSLAGAPSLASASLATTLPDSASPDPPLAGAPSPGAASPGAVSPDPTLADEVSRALDRVLGRR